MTASTHGLKVGDIVVCTAPNGDLEEFAVYTVFRVQERNEYIKVEDSQGNVTGGWCDFRFTKVPA
jgi:hypothetical protein